MHFGDELLLKSVRRAMPQVFIKSLVSDLNSGHLVACAHMEKNFSQPIAKDMFPIYRRAIVEDKIKETARNHNFTASSVYNRIKSASHVEIEIEDSANKIILTTLAVSSAYDMTKLRSAQFRKTLAEESQLHLFKDSIESGDGFYGILLYGSKMQNKEIDFAYLGFPTANCKEWYGHYNLLKLAMEVSDTEIIKDKVTPKLRTNFIRKES